MPTVRQKNRGGTNFITAFFYVFLSIFHHKQSKLFYDETSRSKENDFCNILSVAPWNVCMYKIKVIIGLYWLRMKTIETESTENLCRDTKLPYFESVKLIGFFSIFFSLFKFSNNVLTVIIRI